MLPYWCKTMSLLFRAKKWEHMEMNVVHRSARRIDSATHFPKILEVIVGILRYLTAEGASLNHFHQPSLQLKAIRALVLLQSNRDVAAGWG